MLVPTQKANLEQRLVEVQAQYQAQIFSLSQLAGGLEGELTSVRESAMQQSRDYQLLLSTKVQLEREIGTYKALLEGAGEFSGLAVIKTPVTKAEAASSATAGQEYYGTYEMNDDILTHNYGMNYDKKLNLSQNYDLSH